VPGTSENDGAAAPPGLATPTTTASVTTTATNACRRAVMSSAYRALLEEVLGRPVEFSTDHAPVD
jgi:hypothetical protein